MSFLRVFIYIYISIDETYNDRQQHTSSVKAMPRVTISSTISSTMAFNVAKIASSARSHDAPIGLYRENAIAIESEARDPFGGNVYDVTMQITFFIPEFARKERNLHCDLVHVTTKLVSL